MSNQLFRLFSVCCLILGLLLGFTASSAVAQTTAFTYQGKLVDNGNLANTAYDMQFKLFDALSGGTQIGSTLTFDGTSGNPPAVSVTNGIFAVTLDFGTCPPSAPCFDGNPRFLEIAVKPHGSGSYTPLSPRQPITSTPYAMKTMNLTFNGPYNDGTFIFTAANAFVGDKAGIHTVPNPTLNNSIGKWNAFFGAGAGQANTEGSGNAFFGFLSGLNTTTGIGNSFFGTQAGISNDGGLLNTFIGQQAGYSNVFGNTNTFIGVGADFNSINPTGNGNTLLGIGTKVNSGVSNGTAIGGRALVTQSNSLILGSINGVNNANADTNVGIGTTTPASKLHVSGTGIIRARVDSDANAGVALTLSNQPKWSVATVTGGQFQIFNDATGLNALWIDSATNNLGIGTTAPAERLHVEGNGLFTGNLTVGGTLNANLPAGSGNYIQNTTSQQAANFNIGGSGTAGGTLSGNIVNATTQFNLDGQRVLSAGSNNLFAGIGAGTNNGLGSGNAFFGFEAGQANGGGGGNSFFGFHAGNANTDFNNSFFGFQAGQANTTGNANTFYGFDAGFNNTIGVNNTFIGAFAHFNFTANPTGDNNTLLGSGSRVTSGVNNATAIGYLAQVTQSNSLILGSINGVNGANADTNVGIGTTTPQARLTVRASSTNSADNTATFSAPNIGANFSHIHFGTTGDWYIRSASTSGKVVLQDSGGNVGIGTNNPQDKLHVVGGFMRLALLGGAGTTQLCLNAASQVSSCSSSLRYKTNLAPFQVGLSLVNRLRPITFTWKATGDADVGLAAEEVAKVEPLLVTHNDKGEVEGVKYDRVSVVLLNAVKEQQAQIEHQQGEIEHQHQIIEQQQRQFAHQQQEIADLKKLISAIHPKVRRRK